MRNSGKNRKQFTGLAVAALLLAAILPATTTAADSNNEWEYDAMIYLWGASIDATTPGGGDIDISFSDIVKDLDMAFMGSFGARKGKWSLLTDVIYMDISQDGAGSETIPVLGGAFNPTAKVDADIGMKAWIATFGGGYNLFDTEKVTLDLIGGARYLWLEVDTKLDLNVGGALLPTSRKVKVSESDHVWDGIAGVKGQIRLDNNWYLPYYADVGTGDSKYTWQAMAGVGYRFKWGDVLLAYRHLYYDFESDFLLKDVTMSGPALGARFRF